MDRKELRFRILFEHYEHFHASDDYDLDAKIDAIDAEAHEKRAAKAWIIDSQYVEGSNGGALGTRHVRPFIARINNRGIDFVESVMDRAFTEIRGEDGGFDSLSKSDKIKKFATECLGNPATGAICQVTYEAIVLYMGATLA